MVLAKQDIVSHIQAGTLGFSPALDGFQLQPHAVDLRLGYTFRLPKMWKHTDAGRVAVTQDPATMDASDTFEELTLTPGQYFEILPKEFVLGTTLESIHLGSEELMAVLYPRSSVNRRGLAINMSGIIDVGYEGQLIIPLMNNTERQVIRVYPGERVCQIVLMTLSSPVPAADAQQHGLQQAKYHATESVRSQTDSNEEQELIRSGRLDELKEKFSLKR